ncbi:MAG: hypothetical protein QGI78_03145 [Phycisphaerales bacterium]|jgi:hypothetical protein|nr:hypothetical protein [Phycisphaerales bacterium]
MIATTCVLTAALLTAASEYAISVDSLGIGNAWKAGAITPLKVTVSSTASEPVSAWIAWEVPDGDGDLVSWGRPVTLTPNLDTTTWLYAPTQPWATGDTPWSIRLRANDQNEQGALLSHFRFSPKSVNASTLSTQRSTIAVVGTRRIGLANLAGTGKIQTVLEPTITVSGISVNDLPDAWPCYDSIETLVWADAPPELDYKQAKAIDEWVMRGGHLVIILPTIGNPWDLGSKDGPLSSMLENVVTKTGNATLSAFTQIIGTPRTQSETLFTVHSFEEPYETPLFTLQDGRVVATTTSHGVGAYTLIGIDLTDGRLASLGLPKTDLFWNRVLGRRGDTPSALLLQQLEENQLLSGTIPKTTVLPMGGMAGQVIAMSTAAGGRLGTVFILVTLYILVGGPIGYFILRNKQKLRWSWMWFAVVAIVFSVTSWVLAKTTAAVHVPLRHLSIVDQVYGAPRQQVSGWFSLFLADYASTEVSIEGQSNLLMPWTPPELSKVPSFADTHHIQVPIDHVPSSFTQPTRATTSNFRFNWSGGLQSDAYKSLIRVVLHEDPCVRKLQNGTPIGLSGSITNQMDVPLQDVTLIWVTDQRLPLPELAQGVAGTTNPWMNSEDSGTPLNEAHFWRLSSKLDPQEQLHLDTFSTTSLTRLYVGVQDRYSQNKVWDAYSSGATMPQKELQKRLEMLSLFSHLTPPVYRKHELDEQGPPTQLIQRSGGRSLDYAEWFSRPCIIVQGFVKDAPIPIAISVDGEKIQSSDGLTMVRWVYPLGEE